VTTAALIVAAGRGTRAGGSVPKQYAMLAGAPVFVQCLQTFGSLQQALGGNEKIDLMQVVIHPDDAEIYTRYAGAGVLPPVHGGASRQLSVLGGLEALADHRITKVLIHDAARPFVSPHTIRNVIRALDKHAGALAAVPLADTLKRANAFDCVAETIPRAGLWRAQTPQGFRFDDILTAHRNAAAAGRDDFTDDAAIAEWAGLDVALVEDEVTNTKITTEADLKMAERLTNANFYPYPLEPRIGTGFDVHRFTAGDHLILGGIQILHTHGLEGHSDADVVLHALTDAVLGALGDGDIGQHFPPSNPKWKGAASHIFLGDAVTRVIKRGGRIANADVTLLCEAPQIGPHREAMQRMIADIMGINPVRVGVKATTTEGLGFTGRREGIAAMASVMLLLP
jgi:2-C-methyl-D-erythritol 4-phosphate cytidylyltransferase / 2-C-methyl-D-erythritol 2,4-cyclodiphosphate synthase